MTGDILALAADLQHRRRPFVLATVVWARGPSSGKQGSAALIERDGTIHGWIGGACAEPSVVRLAREVLEEGAARLVYLGPADELDGYRRSGVVTVPIACSSEGALEVFMEPVQVKPQLVVVGRSPAVRTLAALAGALDWETTIVDDGGSGEDHPDAAAVVTSLDAFAALEIEGGTPIVVATQGHYDEPAIETALASRSGYIGLVASATRAETVLGYLRDRGLAEDQIGRVHSPAGLDLGHVGHREIAVAVLAELVALRASGHLSLTATVGTGERDAPHTAIDPVCAMTVEVATARFTATHEGRTFYFCCPACKNMFEQEPATYAGAAAESG